MIRKFTGLLDIQPKCSIDAQLFALFVASQLFVIITLLLTK